MPWREEIWERRSAFFPMFLVTLTLALWAGFQTFQLVRERAVLRTVRTTQERPLQHALEVRTRLDAIVKQLAALAAQGNPGAKTIVDELRQRGISINLQAPPPAAPP